ncbi:MAG: PIN domain-containing protein [Kiritimatiellae bacterium]|nr:PIN domain-containing protein [Kiritimatiellia bacterium]
MDPTEGDIVWVDTNVLLTATDRHRAGHRDAQRVIAGIARSGIHLALSGQILREYLVVATRPADVNGLGLAPTDALANAEEFLRHTAFYEETEAVAARLREVVRAKGITGARIHDANVAATMSVHGVRFLLTENADDFGEMPGVRVVQLPALAARLPAEEPNSA